MADRRSAKTSSERNSLNTQENLHDLSDTENEQDSTDSGLTNMSTNRLQNAVSGTDSIGSQAPINSIQLQREDHAKTVDEIFAFINEGFSLNENVPKEGSATTFDFGSSHQHSTRTSTTDPNTVTSPGFKSGNIVNFNRQESLKEPNPEKEIDEFLPEAKTVDLSLNTASWKGRTPPAQIVEIGSEESSRQRSDFFGERPGSGNCVTYIDVIQKDTFRKSDKPTASTVRENRSRPLQVKIPQEDSMMKSKEPAKKRRKSQSSTKPSGTRQSTRDETSSSKHHKTSKGTFRDTVNAAEKSKISGRVTEGKPAHTNTVPTSSRHEPGKIHVRLDSQDPRLSLLPLSYTKEPSTKEENIKVYVNVNVNMNKENHKPTHSEFDFRGKRRPMLTENDLSDRSSSTISENGYENSELDSSIVSDRSLDINQKPTPTNIPPFQPSNNLSHLTIDRFRMTHKVGPGGLSPIPSESYESDTTNFPSDFSDLKGTPTNTDGSSDSTIKGMASVGDFDDEDEFRHVASASHRGSGKGKLRKISFEKSENDIYFDRSDGYNRGRSYSQPEQYLLDKRQNAFRKIKMGLPSEYHRKLERISSDLYSEDQNPLSCHPRRLSSGDDSTYRPSYMGDDDPDSVNFNSTLTRQDLMLSSWNPRSPYSSRVSRTSSILSDSSRSGRGVRQLSVDIGEEWENIHQPIRPRTTSDVGSVSSGFSYRSLRKTRHTTEMLAGTEAKSLGIMPFRDRIETIVKPGTIVADDVVPDDIQVTEWIEAPVAVIQEDVQPTTDVAGPVVIEVVEPGEEVEERSPKIRFLLDNPYNSINQKFHAALHCPCFLFFCFLCCSPAVYWMQRSDYEFDYASEKLAKRYGKRATVLYIIGIVMSILLFAAAIATTYFLLEKELLRKGHLK